MALNILTSKAIFLDKDGTLVEDVPYNVDPAKIVMTEGTLEGLKLLHSAGYKLFVFSNQSGVARGLFKESELARVEEHLRAEMAKVGVPLSGFYYCPHHPDGRVREYAVPCICRKPRPGMLFQAAREHQINLASSWVIGDILDDVEAGRRADCSTILIDNGNETEWTFTPYRRPHYTAPSLLEAAQVIDHLRNPAPLGDLKSYPSSAGAAL